MLLVAFPKDLFFVHFCFQYMLTTCQMYLAYQIQLCLPMILTFSLTIRTLKDFTVVNNELVNIRTWFTANKLSLNVEKTKYSFFHKPSKKDDIPLRQTKIIIDSYEIQIKESIKFLGVLLDQHLTRKKHIKLTENKIAKNIDILYKARPYLDKKALLCLYYSYIHSYLNYTNTAWCRTNRTYI